MLRLMSEEPEKLAEGTLISHLLELRDRLIRAIIGVALAFLPCMFYSSQIFTFVATRTYSSPLFTKIVAVPPACFTTSSTMS